MPRRSAFVGTERKKKKKTTKKKWSKMVQTQSFINVAIVSRASIVTSIKEEYDVISTSVASRDKTKKK